MVEKNNSIIKNIVDLEKEKNKLKWSFAKPSSKAYMPLKNRVVPSSFQPGATIVRASLQKPERESILTNITSKEIIENLRDVDSQRDRRLKSCSDRKKLLRKNRRENQYSEGRKFDKTVKMYAEADITQDNSFFITNQTTSNFPTKILGDYEEHQEGKFHIPVFKTEFQNISESSRFMPESILTYLIL